MCKIKYHTGFKERRECLDKHESLRITILLVETREGSVTEEIHVREHWKRRKNQLWEGKRSQKGQRKKISQRIKCWRFEMLQKMGDTWPWKCESPRDRLQRHSSCGFNTNDVIIWSRRQILPSTTCHDSVSFGTQAEAGGSISQSSMSVLNG